MGNDASRAVERECPLHITMLRAANLNDARTIRQCIEIEGADPSYRAVKSCSRITALHLSASKGCVDAADCLLSLHADPNQPDDNGVSALQFAAHAGKNDVGNILLAAGADANHTEKRMGASALHFAASRGHVEMVSLLLENDADVDAVVPGRQWTPLHHAASGTQNTAGDVCELILSAKTPSGGSIASADSSMVARYGLTPLIVAVKSGSLTAVQALLRHRSFIDSRDSAKLSALDWAVLLHKRPNSPHILQAVRAAEATEAALPQPVEILERVLSCVDELGITDATYVLSSAHTVLLRRPMLSSVAKVHMPKIEQLILSSADHPQLLHWGFSLLRSVAVKDGYGLSGRVQDEESDDSDGSDGSEPALHQMTIEDSQELKGSAAQLTKGERLTKGLIAQKQLTKGERMEQERELLTSMAPDFAAPVLPQAAKPAERDLRGLMTWTLETYVSDPLLQRAALEALLSCESPGALVEHGLREVQKLIQQYAGKPRAVSLLLKREIGFELERKDNGKVMLSGHAAPGALLAVVPGCWRVGDSCGAPPVYASANWTQATRAPGLPGKELQHQGGWALHSAQMPDSVDSNPLAVGHLLKSSVLNDGGCNALYFSFMLPRAVVEELSDVWPICRLPDDDDSEIVTDAVIVTPSVDQEAEETVAVTPAEGAPPPPPPPPPPPAVAEADAADVQKPEETAATDTPKQSWGNWLFGRGGQKDSSKESGAAAEQEAQPVAEAALNEEVVADDVPDEQPFKLDPDLVMGVAVFALRHISDEEIIVDSNMHQDAFLDAF